MKSRKKIYVYVIVIISIILIFGLSRKNKPIIMYLIFI